jgi:hypothetical protein
MKTIHATTDYKLHVNVQNVPTGEQCLTIKSSWPGAKDPDEKRLLFQATLEPRVMEELVSTIEHLRRPQQERNP